MIILVASIVLIRVLYSKKENEKRYEIVDSSIVPKGTPIYYKDYRHMKVYISNTRTEKAINRYVSQEGIYLETVARTWRDKELTLLDKAVFVLKMEDEQHNKLTISYDVERISSDYIEKLKELSVGQSVELKEVTQGISYDISSYAYILVNRKQL